MSIYEYAVRDDFFQCDEKAVGRFDFPCCVCKFRENKPTEEECRFCGHNLERDEYFTCVVCGELVPGNPYDDGFYMAASTVSRFGPVCKRCYDNFIADIKNR